jgi:hypothetical protein
LQICCDEKNEEEIHGFTIITFKTNAPSSSPPTPPMVKYLSSRNHHSSRIVKQDDNLKGQMSSTIVTTRLEKLLFVSASSPTKEIKPLHLRSRHTANLDSHHTRGSAQSIHALDCDFDY